MSDTPRMSDRPEGFPGAGSLSWRYLGQWRLLTTIGRAIVLETAHPVVDAGVVEFSTYRKHPWRRIEQTLLSLQRLLYQDEADREREAARLRRLHGHVNGVDAQGRAYSALDPEAQAWVHLTVFDAMVLMCELGGDPLDEERQAELYAEWLLVGLQFGVPADAMPGTVEEFRVWFDETVRDKLTAGQGVEQLLDALGRLPAPAALSFVPEAVWSAGCAAFGAAIRTVVASTLPPSYREQLGERGRVPFGAETMVSLACRTAAVASDLLPTKWVYMPLAATYIAAKREAGRGLRRFGPHDRAAEPAAQLADLFVRILDQTGDGVLSWPDLAALARVFSDRLDLAAVDEEVMYAAFHAWWDELRTTADTDGDGVVDADEYRVLADAAPGAAMAALMVSVAAAVDRDGDGRIDQADYARLLGADAAATQRIAWLHAMDADGDGVVTVEEFADALRESVLGRARSDTLEFVLGRA
ncbi:oxygenase MpaB family protein [Embleya sp. NPDC005971]|uniref:oxygenase MpaB family protein n=1 Tax=Embleya sp. NPDC005971 TaxID=3156724 RepID=UPI0033CF61B9